VSADQGCNVDASTQQSAISIHSASSSASYYETLVDPGVRPYLVRLPEC